MLNRYADIKAMNEKGYNCAQSMACAYVDLTGISESDMFRLAECLGGGIGRMQGVCGALTGAYLIASYVNSDGKLSENKTKADTYAQTQKIQKAFIKKMGSDICLTLMKGEKPKPGVCFHILQTASEVLEEFLEEKGIKA